MPEKLKRVKEQVESLLVPIMEDRAPDSFGALGARLFLRTLAALFSGIVRLRLFLFNIRIRRPYEMGCQVISIGNLTVGGTGKTPVVETFARTLGDSGRKVAILSRGYKSEPLSRSERRRAYKKAGGKEPPRVVSDGTKVLLDSAQGGDEPYMLALNLPGVAVIVGADRVASGRYAIRELGCDTLILDDGFQYLRIQHRLDIVLVDATNPFGNRSLLPRGILRESIRNIRRAGFIFITKSSANGNEELIAELRKHNPTAEIVECRHAPKFVKNLLTNEEHPLEFLDGKKVTAVSGIAAPEGFEKQLGRLGAEVYYHKRFNDHHPYTTDEISNVIAIGRRRGGHDLLITTEKDAVRFPKIENPGLPLYYLRVEIEMLSGTHAFRNWINRICFNNI